MKFLIPWLSDFRSNPIESMFDRHRDQSLMASRLYYACQFAGAGMSDQYPDPKDRDQHFLYDYFLNRTMNGKSHFFSEPPMQKNILFLCECGEKESRVHKDKKSDIQFNPFVCNYLRDFDKDMFYRSNILDKFNSKELTVPLGSIASFCKKKYSKTKTIVLDEPHCWSIREMGSSKNFSRQDAFSFIKAIEICKILEKRGFRILTFLTRSKVDFFLEMISDDWIAIKPEDYCWTPYLEMLNLYSQGTMFFSHYQETHGFSVYDNLQMGNGVIIFEENFNPFVINQFQNGVKLGLRISPEKCSDMVEEYYEQYSERTFNQIVQDSLRNFSCETYIKRFRKALLGQRTTTRIMY